MPRDARKGALFLATHVQQYSVRTTIPTTRTAVALKTVVMIIEHDKASTIIESLDRGTYNTLLTAVRTV